MNESDVVNRKNNKAQTKLHVYPHTLNENVSTRVLTRSAIQTVITLPPFDDISTIISLLEYLPYREISLNCIREIELPHKSRISWLTDSIIKSDRKMETNDFNMQTDLSVSPHILEEDEIAVVVKEIDMQTSLTFTPNTSINTVLRRLKENLDHIETYKNEDVANDTTEDEITVINQLEHRIGVLLEEAVEQLQERLNNLLSNYTSETLNPTSIKDETVEEDPDKTTMDVQNDEVDLDETILLLEEEVDENNVEKKTGTVIPIIVDEDTGIGDTRTETFNPPTLNVSRTGSMVLLDVENILLVVSESKILKKGYQHDFAQTESIMLNCTGTNFDSGDDRVKRFTSEGVGTMEFACQCLEKVNTAAQDGNVETIPIEEKSPVIALDANKVMNDNFVGCTCASSESTLNEQMQKVPSQHTIINSLESDEDIIPCECKEQECKTYELKIEEQVQIVEKKDDEKDNDETDVDKYKDIDSNETLFMSFDCITSTPTKSCKYAVDNECCGMAAKNIFDKDDVHSNDSKLPFEYVTSTPKKQTKYATRDVPSSSSIHLDMTNSKEESMTIRKDIFMDVDAAPTAAAQKPEVQDTNVHMDNLENMIENDDVDILNTAMTLYGNEQIHTSNNKEKIVQTSVTLINCTCDDEVPAYVDVVAVKASRSKECVSPCVKDVTEDTSYECTCNKDDNYNLVPNILNSTNESFVFNIPETDSSEASHESFIFDINISELTEEEILNKNKEVIDGLPSKDIECVDYCIEDVKENESYACSCKEETYKDEECIDSIKINIKDELNDSSFECTCDSDDENAEAITHDSCAPDVIKENNISYVCSCDEYKEKTDHDLENVHDEIEILALDLDEQILTHINQSSQTSDELLLRTVEDKDQDYIRGISTHTMDCLNINTCADDLTMPECTCDTETNTVEELYVTDIKSMSDEGCKCYEDSQECTCSLIKSTSMAIQMDGIAEEDTAKNVEKDIAEKDIAEKNIAEKDNVCTNCECAIKENQHVSLQTSVVSFESDDKLIELTSAVTSGGISKVDKPKDDSVTDVFTSPVEQSSLRQKDSAESCTCTCISLEVDDVLPEERQLFLDDIMPIKSSSNESFICDCIDDDYIALLQKESSFVTCNDETCSCCDVSITIDDNLETCPIGDNNDVKRHIHILCECMPTVAGAAPPYILDKGLSLSDGIGPQVQSLQRLFNENPNNLEAFMQRLRDMASTKEGKKYIRTLPQETINFLNDNGYEDELKTLLLSSAPSYYLFNADPIYIEGYMAGLEITRSVDATVRSDYSLVDNTDAGECTEGVEIPWYKIELPDARTYKIKDEKSSRQELVGQGTKGEEKKPKVRIDIEDDNEDEIEETSKIISKDKFEGEYKGKGVGLAERRYDVEVSDAKESGKDGEDGKTEAEQKDKPKIEQDVEIKTEVEQKDEMKIKVEQEDEIKTMVEQKDEIKIKVEQEDEIKTTVKQKDDINIKVEPEDEIKTMVEQKDEIKLKVEQEDEIKSDGDIEDKRGTEDKIVRLVSEEGKIEDKSEERGGDKLEEREEDKSDVDDLSVADGKPVKPSDAETDCVETYQRKFRLLVDTQKLYYHEPQYESLYRQYESDEDEECGDDLVLQWKDIMLRTNATIIPTKDVPVPSLHAIKTEPESDKVNEDEEDFECKCLYCPAVEGMLQKEEDTPPKLEVKAVTQPTIVDEELDDGCVCKIDVKKEEIKTIKQEPKVCAANVPRQLTCSPKEYNKPPQIESYSKECIENKCSSIPENIQKLYEDNCVCEPTPKFCTCDGIEDADPPQTQNVVPAPQPPPPTTTTETPNKSSKVPITKDLLEKSDCICLAGKKKEKIKKTYCLGHTCHNLNTKYFTNATKHKYTVDECTCEPEDKHKQKQQITCHNEQQDDGNVKQNDNNISKRLYQKSISQLLMPCPANIPRNNQLALILHNLHLAPINTKSLCNSNTSQPLGLTFRTISMPHIDKNLIKSQFVTKDFQCQCNDMSKLVDEGVCTDLTTQMSNRSTNKDPVLAALAAYQAEMKPLKETLCQLREKIRHLNLSDNTTPTSMQNDELFYSGIATTSTNTAQINEADYAKRNEQNNSCRSTSAHLPPYFWQQGLMPGINPPLPSYFTGLYPQYNHSMRYPNYPFQQYPIPQPNFPNINYNLHKPKETENQSMKKFNNNNNNGVNLNYSDISSISLKTTTTQTKQKKRDRKRKKPNVSPDNSSDTSEYSVINVASSSSKFPVKEEKIKVEKNLDVKYSPNGTQRTDIGPAFVDVRAVESGGKYNLKIALKMKPPDANSTTPPISNSNNNSSHKNYHLK